MIAVASGEPVADGHVSVAARRPPRGGGVRNERVTTSTRGAGWPAITVVARVGLLQFGQHGLRTRLRAAEVVSGRRLGRKEGARRHVRDAIAVQGLPHVSRIQVVAAVEGPLSIAVQGLHAVRAVEIAAPYAQEGFVV